MNERIHFDPARLDERQLDGVACVVCGIEFTVGSVSAPAGIVDHTPVFACIAHLAAERTGCPAWCTSHTTGRDAITGAASTAHYGQAVTAAALAPAGTDASITVVPLLIVTAPSAALGEQRVAEVRITHPGGWVDTVTPAIAVGEATWLERNGAHAAATAIRSAVATLTAPPAASIPGTWPNGEPQAIRDASDSEECTAEFIDEMWTFDDCGCVECRERTGRNGDA